MQDSLYEIGESSVLSPSNNHFYLHAHGEYEMFLFLEGDSKYVVEEKNYDLNPGDIIIIRRHEMHRIYHNSSKKYHRIVFMIYRDFFQEINCPK